MKLLVVSPGPFWPLDSGASQRRFHLTQGLTRAHRVTLVTFDHPALPDAGAGPLAGMCDELVSVPLATCAFARTTRFDDWPSAPERLRALLSSPLPSLVRRWQSPALLDLLRRFRLTGGFDAVWVEKAFMAEMVRRAGFERIVVDLPDLESVAYARAQRKLGWHASMPLRWAEWLKLHRHERSLPRRYWRVSVCKEEDRRFFGPQPERKIFLVPNGVAGGPPPPPHAEDAREVLFVGVLSYQPNADAVHYFVREILPTLRGLVPGVRFRAVGMTPDASVLALDNGVDCIVAGSVPDVSPYLERAAVVVVPMRLGSGTKIKVLEALARGKAVVSTTFGIQGIAVRPGVDLETADTPAAFAASCARLLSDETARRRLGESGRQRVLERYRWDAITPAACDAVAL